MKPPRTLVQMVNGRGLVVGSRNFRRLERHYARRVEAAMYAIETGRDLEHEFNVYVTMTGSWIIGKPPVETLLGMLEIEDPILIALYLAIPAADRDAVIERFLRDKDR